MSCAKDLMIIEFTQSIGPVEIDMVALFNSKVISADEVDNIIKVLGTEVYQKDIVFMTKEQWKSLKGETAENKELKVQEELLKDLMMEQKEQM